MKSVSISGSPRTNVGKKDAKATRRAKHVPCVLYGGTEQIHFSVLEADFKPLIYTPDVHTVNLDIAGKKYHAIVQETQYHKVHDHLLHVDFLEIVAGKHVVMNLPVRTSGTSPGVRSGGKLSKKLKTLRAKGLVENMPDAVVIPIDEMQIGNSVRVADVKIEGLTFLNAKNITIISVETTRAVVEVAATTAATGAKPAAGAAKPAAGAAKPAAGAAKPAAAPKAAPGKK